MPRRLDRCPNQPQRPMSQERELLTRALWAVFFAIGLIVLAWLFHSWVVLPAVMAFVLYFTLTKKA